LATALICRLKQDRLRALFFVVFCYVIKRTQNRKSKERNMRKNEYLLVALIAMLAGYVGSMLPVFATRIEADEAVLKKPTIEAREIRLVDADGRVVLEMGSSPEAVGQIVFRDQQGIVRCAIGQGKDGASGLEMYNSKGVSLGSFGASVDGAVGVRGQMD
jgi:hypothetical protein